MIDPRNEIVSLIFWMLNDQYYDRKHMVRIHGSLVTLELLSSRDYKEVGDKLFLCFVATCS